MLLEMELKYCVLCKGKKKLPNNEDTRLLLSLWVLVLNPNIYSLTTQSNPIPSVCSQPFRILSVHVRSVFIDEN